MTVFFGLSATTFFYTLNHAASMRCHSGVIALLARGTLIKQKATAESCPKARLRAVACDGGGETDLDDRSRLIGVQGVCI